MHHHYFILTGVSGSGKTTLGQLLAAHLGIDFYDADAFHSREATEKMRNGTPLDDTDRAPWLERINLFLKERASTRPLVLACSALTVRYRQWLSEGIASDRIAWFHLSGSEALIAERLQRRRGHFMPPALLGSQLATWETPLDGQVLDVGESIGQLLQRMRSQTGFALREAGVVGLGVMGLGLARNLASRGWSLSIYNRRVDGKEEQVALHAAASYPDLYPVAAYEDIALFVASLQKPRKIILMVQAGHPIDALIPTLLPLLSPGDVVIDGGNSLYKDTIRRQALCDPLGIHWLGVGISGGEEGALLGPSIMPGGSKVGYETVRPLLESMAARNTKGELCCRYIGGGGAGHFVKMVHNGIEYAEMQLLTELYAHLRYDQHRTTEDIAVLFDAWQQGGEGSYLLDITRHILRHADHDGQPLLDKISDQAGNKGTGSWATIAASELGIPVPSFAEALFSRYVSALRRMRQQYQPYRVTESISVALPADQLRSLYYFVRVIHHLQGLHLIQAASQAYGWSISLQELLQTWSGGCIIRSELLSLFREELEANGGALADLPIIQQQLGSPLNEASHAVSLLMRSPLAYPQISSALQFAKSISTAQSAAYLIQAQRDFFGAHTFQWRDDPDGPFFHASWHTP